MQFIADHLVEIVAVLGALHTIALVIVNATPTPKDNEALAKLYRVVELIAGFITPKAKEADKPEEVGK